MLTVTGNLKGGSGKSTVAFNIGVWLATQEIPVLLFDLDPQQTLTDVMEVRNEEGFLPEIDLISADAFRRSDIPDDETEVIIDVGSANIAGMKQALKLADRVLIPVPPSQADVWSTQRFLYMVASTVSDKHPPEVITFLNRADTHHQVRESDETEAALKTLPGIEVLTTRLAQRTPFRRSFSEGLAVFELGRSSKASREFLALAKALYPKL